MLCDLVQVCYPLWISVKGGLVISKALSNSDNQTHAGVRMKSDEQIGTSPPSFQGPHCVPEQGAEWGAHRPYPQPRVPLDTVPSAQKPGKLRGRGACGWALKHGPEGPLHAPQ